MTFSEKEKMALAWLNKRQNEKNQFTAIEKNQFTAITTSVLLSTIRYLEKNGYFREAKS